jgi:hypothetical protein
MAFNHMTTMKSEIPIGPEKGRAADQHLGSAYIHDLPHNEKMAKHLGKPVKLHATVESVNHEVDPMSGEKKMSVRFHVHGIHGITGLGDNLKEKPVHSNKEKELEDAMADAKI